MSHPNEEPPITAPNFSIPFHPIGQKLSTLLNLYDRARIRARHHQREAAACAADRDVK